MGSLMSAIQPSSSATPSAFSGGGGLVVAGGTLRLGADNRILIDELRRKVTGPDVLGKRCRDDGAD